MNQKINENLEDAVIDCLDRASSCDDSEEACKLVKTGIEGYHVLMENDKDYREELRKEEDRKDFKKKVLNWVGGILTVLIPAIVVEGMQERFMDKQANKAYEFEKTGTVTTTPGRNFIGGMFKPRSKR